MLYTFYGCQHEDPYAHLRSCVTNKKVDDSVKQTLFSFSLKD